LARIVVLALWVVTFLMWIFISIRAVVYEQCWCDPIIDGNPIPDWVTAALSFVLNFVLLVVYLTYWGWPNMPRAPR
jgi:hypothetical protein